MIRIKFICLALIGIIVLSSCSSDDDSNNDAELLIGTWKPILLVQVCTSGSENVNVHPECVQMGRYSFFENGTYDFSDYSFNCEELSIIGTWSISEENLILIREQHIDTITFFEVTNDKFRSGLYSVNPNDTCDGVNPLSHWYSELIRVEE